MIKPGNRISFNLRLQISNQYLLQINTAVTVHEDLYMIQALHFTV